MNKIFYGLIIFSFAFACSPKSGEIVSGVDKQLSDQVPISASINLNEVNKDRVWVEIDPGVFSKDSVIFRLPRIVQGTYAVSDFGSFIEEFKAWDYSGAEITTNKVDTNTWVIPDGSTLDRLGYYVNDTFDIENTDKPTPFSPSGTNIDENNFVLNLHGFVGYFESLQNNGYSLSITAPVNMKKTSALEVASSDTSAADSTVTDVYFAERYFQVTDNPMMYGNLDVEEFFVEDIKIVLSVYSPSGMHSAASIKETIATMMEAQKEYLGEINTTNRYDIYLYLAQQTDTSPRGFGALEHHTSTIVVMPEAFTPERMAEVMTNVVSHEFFHIVTPLNVHSEDVHYFDYNDPTFSKHLWMYEGVTEYFASHFQVFEGLQSRHDFYDKIQGKIETSWTLADSMSFTVMSENILEEPYASNFYNVYMKGALFGMCIDILMREESNGKRSMLSLMKELSSKYGKEEPFEDEKLVSEISAMTYPSVREFLETHVVEDTPIDYSVFFNKVGLEMVEGEKQTSLLFIDFQNHFFSVNQETGQLYFKDMELNSSLVEMGVKSGDIIKSINETNYSADNMRSLIGASYQWAPETNISMVIIREGEEISLSGKVGSPVISGLDLREVEVATEEQIKLRNFWLGN